MAKYILRRLGFMLPTMLLVSIAMVLLLSHSDLYWWTLCRALSLPGEPPAEIAFTHINLGVQEQAGA